MKKYINISTLRKKFIKIQGSVKNKKKSIKIINELLENKHTYLFDWFGIPIIQFPNDVIVLQELIYKIKPKYIIECGIAHGGMLVFYASILRLLNIKNFKVLGIDIKIRNVNKKRIINSGFYKNIDLYEKSSTDSSLFKSFEKKYFFKKNKKLIILDSNHTKDHVLNELNFYSKILNKGDYIIVMDTVIEFINQKFNKNKNFKRGNSPFNAVKIFLKQNKNFVVDKYYENKSFLTGARNGFLKKIK
jgi:cephalosporin hydroxylase